MGSSPILPAVARAALACVPPSAAAQASLTRGDRAAIAGEIAHMATTARQAWATRNAKILIPDSTLSVRTPDGRTLNAAEMRADLQRRMDATTRVDTLIEVLDSVRVVTRDSALAYSSQRFVRLMRIDGRAQRARG